jgi:hypothetical protein
MTGRAGAALWDEGDRWAGPGEGTLATGGLAQEASAVATAARRHTKNLSKFLVIKRGRPLDFLVSIALLPCLAVYFYQKNYIV